jgi:riboflavin synthase
VVDIHGKEYSVTAIKETLERSNLGLLEIGSKVNIERSMLMNGRLDGHIVQGHVDTTAVCTAVREAEGSFYYCFKHQVSTEMQKRGYFVVDKGSVTVNGVSLTVCNPRCNTFEVAIIPYTFENTNFCEIHKDTIVNLEFDIIGKYIAKLASL